MTAPLSAAEAARRILDDVRRQPALRVPLDDALDSVLAEDLVSPIDIPAWTNSAMDGFAVRAADTAGAAPDSPRELRLAGESRAGHPAAMAAGAGEAIAISTGAMIPDGADAVVRVEDTERRDDVELIDARPFLLDAQGQPVPVPGPGPTVQLWPHVHGTDGMFLALVRKSGPLG